MLRYEAAIATSQGARRYQEDAAALWPRHSAQAPLIAVLADGMGGHAGGATASRIVCETFIDRCKTGTGPTNETLVASLDEANRLVAVAARAQPSLRGMGATLIGAIFTPAGLEWVSVGDSPLYLYRQSQITLLNEDHSLAPALDELAAKGEITLEQARNDPRRHMLRSAVTGEDLDLIDVSRSPRAIAPGDCVLLASDGIHAIPNTAIGRIVSDCICGGAQAVADAIVRAVLDAGDPHQDNVTVVAVRPIAVSEEGDANAG